MTAAIVTAITEIVTVLRGVSGLKNVPINPPEQMNYDTYAVVYPERGSIDVAPIGTRESLHNIAIDVLTTRTDLARDMARLEPFLDTIPNALLSEMTDSGDIFSNSIETFGALTYAFISTDYGGTPVIGYRFVMEGVKIQVNL